MELQVQVFIRHASQWSKGYLSDFWPSTQVIILDIFVVVAVVFYVCSSICICVLGYFSFFLVVVGF